MTSPMLTVVVLAVLWLIVVVPMIVRRNDDRARDRSVEGFGRAMRALTRRHVALSRPVRSRPAAADADFAAAEGLRACGPRRSCPERHTASTSHLLCGDPFPPPRRR